MINNENNENTPPEGKIPNRTGSSHREDNPSDNGFDRFWQAYPKKVKKLYAQKAWSKLKPNAELQQVILSALEQQKRSVQWQEKNGQYIPDPTTWLNGHRWEDDFEQSAPSPPQTSDFDPNDPYKDWR